MFHPRCFLYNFGCQLMPLTVYNHSNNGIAVAEEEIVQSPSCKITPYLGCSGRQTVIESGTRVDLPVHYLERVGMTSTAYSGIVEIELKQCVC